MSVEKREPSAQEIEDRLGKFQRCLIMTVGLPCSGKSSWAKKQGFTIVNPDSVRLALHGRDFFGPAEQMVWAITRIMVRSLFMGGARIIILDATNTTRARRDEWVVPDWATFYRVFDTPKSVCLERAAVARGPAMPAVIDRMAESFEPLHADELERLW